MEQLSIRAQAKLYGISKSAMAADRAAGCPATEEGGRIWRALNRRPYLRLSRQVPIDEKTAKAECKWWAKAYERILQAGAEAVPRRSLSGRTKTGR